VRRIGKPPRFLYLGTRRCAVSFILRPHSGITRDMDLGQARSRFGCGGEKKSPYR
jgi:hypothetical protein